ncbi:MAG: ABC transporter substrate-binding protein [Planctomycetota bacterium]
MKYLFLIFFVVLSGMAGITVLTAPDTSSDVPVLYWVTDANPARYEQVDLFHQWLIDNGYVTEDGKPIMELRLDTASADPTKKIIQSVAGVAGDIMDCDLAQMRELGVLEDVTDVARELGFDPSVTYPGVRSILEFEGRQYGFPCNVATSVMWANVDTFAQYGMEPPPLEMDADEFERIGLEYVERANADNPAKRRFFCESLAGWQSDGVLLSMLRSSGKSFLNETMTESRLDQDSRFLDILDRFYRWTYVYNLTPTAAQESSFSAQAGYGGGAGLALFQTGQYGIIMRGRWGLIRVRQFENPPNVSVSLPPTVDGGLQNLVMGSRRAGIYKGSKHKDLAALFLAYLASEPYSAQIVKSADALPPLPSLAETEEFIRPADFPNEWGVHDPIDQAARRVGIAGLSSPFVPTSYIVREVSIARDHVMTNNPVKTPERAVADCVLAINQEIARDVAADPNKQALYDELTETQARIDAYRAEGRPVPLEWITNPFYRWYYVQQGWAVAPEETAQSDLESDLGGGV